MPKPVVYFLLVMLLSFNVAASGDWLSPGLTPAELLEKLDTEGAPRVVDVRKPVEFGIAHIPGAVNIPLEELEDQGSRGRTALTHLAASRFVRLHDVIQA